MILKRYSARKVIVINYFNVLQYAESSAKLSLSYYSTVFHPISDLSAIFINLFGLAFDLLDDFKLGVFPAPLG